MSDQPKKQELPPHIEELNENSKLDHYLIAGSQVREVIGLYRAALSDNEAKDARIAELEQDRNRHACNAVELMRQRDAAEAKLKSVEGIMREYEDDPGIRNLVLARIREAIQ
jgi:hypothetical protein